MDVRHLPFLRARSVVMVVPKGAEDALEFA
jgi:hypothetical protein